MSGNMFKTENIKPVTREQLKAVISDLQSKLGNFGMFSNPSLEYRTLGSSAICDDGQLGKKESMGDIDIAVSPSSSDELTDLTTIEEIIRKNYPMTPIRKNTSLRIVSILYSISPNHDVQVDFILGNFDILKFMFTSPDPSHTTTYKKGFYRNFYLSALTQMMRETIQEGDCLIAFAGPKLDRHTGITFEYRHHPIKKIGTGRIKQIKRINRSEFKTLYGKDVPLPELPLTDPQEIISYFFPKSKYSISEYDTVELLRKAIRENYSETLAEKIEKRFQEIVETSK